MIKLTNNERKLLTKFGATVNDGTTFRKSISKASNSPLTDLENSIMIELKKHLFEQNIEY